MESAEPSYSDKVVIENRLGLHARPAMALVELANQYEAELTLRKGEQEVDGKSIMQVMMLAATQGTELKVETAGPDAEDLLAALKSLVERRFDEE